MKIIEFLIRKLKGSFRCAKEQGMVVGKNVSVMGGVDFGSEPYLITLHDNCRISCNVTFINHDGGTWAFRNDNERYKHVVKYGTIEVGEYTFIGANSTIMPGVKIGDHCVIGACSLVNKDVPSGTIVGGVPAKFICKTIDYAERCLNNMPNDFDEDAYFKDKKKYLIEHYMRKKE